VLQLQCGDRKKSTIFAHVRTRGGVVVVVVVLAVVIL
jgi:hypothetical protein